MLVLRRQLMLLLASVVLVSPLAAAEMKTVAVTAIVEHPALDAARDGIREALAEAGWKEGESLAFSYESA
jgi:putative tryptophan/tyrosine transport system substrate-binding protein